MTTKNEKLSASIQELFDAGSHFGHPSRRWNPKMTEYIHSKRNGSHIINLSKTQEKLLQAVNFIESVISDGGNCMFVGTKKHAQNIIKENAERSNSLYINQRWLGGLMTNFKTIERRLERLVELEDSFAKGIIISQTKRESQKLDTERGRLNKFFSGIKEMNELPSVLYVVDIHREKIAVAEARKLNIPVVAMVDTNSDPNQVEYPIPSNDDGLRSIQLITNIITDAIISGQELYQKKQEDQLAEEAELERLEAEARNKAQEQAAKRQSNNDSSAKAEPEVKAEPEAKVEPEAKAETEVKAEPEAKAETEVKAEPEAKAEPEVKTEPK
ncbi:MAG: 30S ribosomal protein S2, partial [Chloroflexi bacterium]|nr:30S ribosomal protein S2 [Chloroflexota bacterium]